MTEKLPELPAGIVDAHAHVFHQGLPLAASRRYAPDYDAPLDAYLAMLDKYRIAFGVLVQPSFLGTDNSFLLESLRAADGRLRGIAVVPETTQRLELRTLAKAGISGIRLNLIGAPVPDFTAPKWIGFLHRVAAEDMHVEVQCRSAEAGAVLDCLIRHHPKVVLDHFGLPEGGNPENSIGFEDMLRFGRAGRVLVKLSATYRFLEEDRVPVIWPFFQALLEAFGPTHLLWGSDWPHTRFETRGNAGRALRAMATLAPDANTLDALLGGTARATYGFSPADIAQTGGAAS